MRGDGGTMGADGAPPDPLTRRKAAMTLRNALRLLVIAATLVLPGCVVFTCGYP